MDTKEVFAVPPMPLEPSNWNDGTTQLVGGYLRPRAYALSPSMGQKFRLGNGEPVEWNNPKYCTTEQKPEDEVKDLYYSLGKNLAAKRKAKMDKEKARRSASTVPKSEGGSDPDPIHWLKTPWRSMHDGMHVNRHLSMKWNDQLAMEDMPQWKMYDAKLRRHKSTKVPLSTYGDSYTHLGVYKPALPTNMYPIPSEPKWKRHEETSQPPRLFKKRECDLLPMNKHPDGSASLWGSYKFSYGGVGGSG